MNSKKILINEDDPELVRNLAEVLRGQGRWIDVLTCTSGAEALEILKRTQVDLLITGLHGSRIDGFQLLAEINFHHAGTRVIVLVGTHTPLPRSALRLMGATESFAKPLDLAELVSCVYVSLQMRLQGEVWGLHLASFLQMLHADRKTCTLTVTKPGQQGRISLVDGELHAAEWGPLHGDDAFYAILAWDDPLIEIDYIPFDRPRTVSAGLMAALMESQRRKDEQLMGAIQQRRHSRFNCLVAVDFDWEHGSYRHLIRDMSEGGAFIESDAQVGIGEEIELVLYALTLQRHCSLRGRVIRREESGFAVEFRDLDDEKRQFIQVLQRE